MTTNCSDNGLWEERLFEVLADFLDSSEAGQATSEAALIDRYPQYAAGLHEFFEARDCVERLTIPMRRAAQTLIAVSPLATELEADVSSAGHAVEAPAAETYMWRPDRYRVDGEVARGGMGVIFRGRDRHLGRDVAFKFLLGKYRADAELRQRFAREARITSRLQHPGVIPVYELGQFSDSCPFFTMPLVKGQSLDLLLDGRSEPSRDVPHFLKIFEQVCQTVAYAHSVGIIHRDLKPANVMVSPFGVVQVMDWGLAKEFRKESGEPGEESVPTVPGDSARHDVEPEPSVSESASGTCAGRVLGTPAFMSPEQARGDGELDERADVYGLGALLCVILIGRPPFVGYDAEEVRARAASGDLAEVFALLDASSAERELVEIAKRCLAAVPADRFRDAGQVAAAITAYLESDLRRAERDLVRFFDLSPDLFCVAGLDGYFRRVNGNFSRVLGYTDRELLSRPFLEFVHADDQTRTIAEMEKLSRGLPVIRFENRYRDVAGGYRWFEWTAKSIPEEGVIFAVARDVTDRIHLERQLNSITASGESGPG